MPAKRSGADSLVDKGELSSAQLTAFDKGGVALPIERLSLLEQTWSHQRLSHHGHTDIAVSAEGSKTDGPQRGFK